MKERIGYIDSAAGIMILWIIMCHAYLYAGLSCLSFAKDISELPQWLSVVTDEDGSMRILYLSIAFPYLMFSMPWFFYKSGMFFSKRSSLSLLQKDARKLLLPYLIWGGVGYIIYLIFSCLEQTMALRSATYSVLRTTFFTGAPPINIALWFLFTLFLVRQIMNKLLPDKEDTKTKFHLRITGIVICSIGIGFFLYKLQIERIPLWVANTVTGCCFFAFGYWLRDYMYNRWVVGVSTCMFIVSCILGLSIVVPMNNTCPQGSYILWVPEALAGIIVFMAICKLFYKDNVFISGFRWLGKHAMQIYVTHYLVCMIIYKSIVAFHLSELSKYSLLLIIIGYLLLIKCFVLMDFIKTKKYTHYE